MDKQIVYRADLNAYRTIFPKFDIRGAFQKLIKVIMTDVGHLPDAPREELPAKQRIEDAFAAVKSVIQASVKPLPAQTGDGSYLPPSAPTGLLKYFGAGAEGFLHDLQHADPNTIETLVKTAKTQITGVTDDRTYLMENIIKVGSFVSTFCQGH